MLRPSTSRLPGRTSKQIPSGCEYVSFLLGNSAMIRLPHINRPESSMRMAHLVLTWDGALSAAAARAASQPARHESTWLAGDLRNVPPPVRPMSSSYKPRFSSGKLNFPTGGAKSATHQLEESKVWQTRCC